MDLDNDFELRNILGDDMDIDNMSNDEGVPVIPHFNSEDLDFSAHIEDSIHSNNSFLDKMNIERVEKTLSNYFWSSTQAEHQSKEPDDSGEPNRVKTTELNNDQSTSVSLTDLLKESLKENIIVDKNISRAGNHSENEFEFIDNILSDEQRFDLNPDEMENILENSTGNGNILENQIQGDQNEAQSEEPALETSYLNSFSIQTVESAQNKKAILDRVYKCIFEELGVHQRSNDNSFNRYGCKFEENPSLTTVGECFNREKLWGRIKPELLKRGVITDEFVSNWCKVFVQIMKISNICPSCEVLFQFKESFSGHLINTEDGKVICPYLCKREMSRPYLQRHIRDFHKIKNNQIHSEEHLFTCEEEGCTRWFRSKHALNIHQNNTHGRRTRTCNNCRSQFGSLDDLLKHRIVAHGLKEGEQKTFQCEIEGCNFVTASKRGFFMHRKRTHNILNVRSARPFSCPMKGCFAAYSTEQGLQNHLSSKHKIT